MAVTYKGNYDHVIHFYRVWDTPEGGRVVLSLEEFKIQGHTNYQVAHSICPLNDDGTPDLENMINKLITVTDDFSVARSAAGIATTVTNEYGALVGSYGR